MLECLNTQKLTNKNYGSVFSNRIGMFKLDDK